jgi:hypothetical protein
MESQRYGVQNPLERAISGSMKFPTDSSARLMELGAAIGPGLGPQVGDTHACLLPFDWRDVTSSFVIESAE